MPHSANAFSLKQRVQISNEGKALVGSQKGHTVHRSTRVFDLRYDEDRTKNDRPRTSYAKAGLRPVSSLGGE